MTVDDVALVLEAVRWCREHHATIRWDQDRRGPVCHVEVLAPGTTWLTLRGAGDTLAQAYVVAREEHRVHDARRRGAVG